MRTSLIPALVLAWPAFAQDAPQSAIPWLSDSLRQPVVTPRKPDEPASSAVTDTSISVMTLGAVRRDAVGLLPTSVTGLPRQSVAGSDPKRLAELFARQPVDALPAMQGLVQMLLLAELDAPRAAADPDALFLTRIDALLRRGAVEQAQALMERAGAADQTAFVRWFDAALLTGDDTRACEAMRANPAIAPTLPARVFCLSRSNDWAAAALTLDTGRAIGAISEEEDALLAHFLDPELFEGEPPPIPPRPMTPLAYRLLDGIGETPSTRDLPLAFSVADLRPNIGWKAQIEAAERLTRGGALDANRLLALYTDRRPSASGGVWERAAAVQHMDAALIGGDAVKLAAALPDVIRQMSDAAMLTPIADLYGERVARALPADPDAMRLGLLSRAYELVAADIDPEAPALRFAKTVALGEPATGYDRMTRAIADGFATQPPEKLMDLSKSDRLGEAVLEAALLLADGKEASSADITQALAFFRAVGMQSLARRVALQLLLT